VSVEYNSENLKVNPFQKCCRPMEEAGNEKRVQFKLENGNGKHTKA
jgi:hypothetical protein